MLTSLNNRRRVQQWLQKTPWMTHVMRIILQWTRPHFTAGVVGVVLNPRGEVLLVEHVFHPQHPWGLPGGWMERGESPTAALKRELREETGIQVFVVYPLMVETGYYFRTHLDIAFLCHTDGYVVNLSSELVDYRWVTLADVPPMLPFHAAAVSVAGARLKTEV